MKTRHGFVSNSSSSSFVIDRHYLSRHQEELIQNHLDASQGLVHPYDEDGWYTGDYSEWNIYVGIDVIEGFTTMDNFDMKAFLSAIGVPEGAIKWED